MNHIDYCKWTENSDHFWDTSCHGSFVLNDGTPKENNMNFCCYCGGVIKQELYKEDKND